MLQLRFTLVAALALAAPTWALAQSITVGAQAQQVPDEHIVEPGDTLWDICEEYFSDPWQWPTLWAINPHVTNPHWIYPGDVLRLRLGADGSGTVQLDGLKYTVGAENAAHVSLNEGFITEEPVEKLGELAYSPLQNQYLAEENLVYLTFEKLDEVRVGQKFSVYDVLNDVDHPVDERRVGTKIKVMGVVEVIGVDEHVARARVTQSYEEIKRGLPLTHLIEHYLLVNPRQNLIDLEGIIIDAMRPQKEIGQFFQVFIDRGAKDGVQVGNRFFVMRRGDGFLHLTPDRDQDLPWEQIGEALVVDTQDRNSTAIVTRAALELRRGDRVVMQRHY